MKWNILFVGSLAAICATSLLAVSISGKENERRQLAQAPSAAGIANKSQSEAWARFYPRQFSSWKKTREGDEIIDILEKKPFYAVALAGYSYSREYNSPRGHFYAVQDQLNTLKNAGAEEKVASVCWTCHSGSAPELIKRDGEKEFYAQTWAHYGPEALNPIGCDNCHNDQTMALEVKLPHLDRGLKAAGLKTFAESTHQEKRTLVCMQCHTEFYTKQETFIGKDGGEKKANLIQLPYKYGTKAKDILKLYKETALTKYTHPISKTPMIKAVHTYWENWQNGIHAKQGVACADCHMPYMREGVVKYTNHQIGSPLDTIQSSCLNCHRESERELRDLVREKKERFTASMDMAFENYAKAHIEIGEALKAGAGDEELAEVRELVRDGQFLADMVLADQGSYFHATEEALKIINEANNTAQEARLKLVRILAAHGVMDFSAPEYDTKEKAQKLIGVNFEDVVQAKMRFKESLEKAWKKEAREKGYIAPDSVVLDPAMEKKPPYAGAATR